MSLCTGVNFVFDFIIKNVNLHIQNFFSTILTNINSLFLLSYMRYGLH